MWAAVASYPAWVIGIYWVLITSSLTQICTRCWSVTRERTSCECGGALEPLDHWEWVGDDDDEPPERGTTTSP